MPKYTYICWIHTDAMNNWRTQDFFIKIFTSHFIARVRKVCVGFYCERELEIEHNCNILTPNSYGRQRCVFLHLISILSGPQTPSGFPRAPSAGRGFPYHISSHSDWHSNWQLARRTQLSYILVRRPLDLWNRMLNRHQAEITVMQFRGHSLPVLQSMSVQWELFSSSHFISQFPPTWFPLITAIRMCHLLPVHHLGMAFLDGSKGQNKHLNIFIFGRNCFSKWKKNCYVII